MKVLLDIFPPFDTSAPIDEMCEGISLALEKMHFQDGYLQNIRRIFLNPLLDHPGRVTLKTSKSVFCFCFFLLPP